MTSAHGPARMDESELVRRIRAGEPDAWNDLVREYERLVHAIPMRMGLTQADAEEVFQNTWILLHAHIQQLRDAQRLRSWISTTARRESWRLQRKNRASLDVEELSLSDSQPGPTEAIEQLELRHTLRRALQALRQPCEALLTLLFFDKERPQYSEVASKLKLPVGSLGPTRARCLADLARYLEERGF
ncbi:MAG: RNA polymerase sigma factor (sigma-70 family) [Chlamydiales bacterium]|jgi:RNA polymerase sigma factor (sigma-70 family)